MHSTKILPVRGAHLWADLRGARWIFSEESDYEIVDLHRHETTEFIEPESAFYPFRRLSDLYRNFSRDWDNRVRTLGLRIVIVERFQVFLQLKRRIDLFDIVRPRLAAVPTMVIVKGRKFT